MSTATDVLAAGGIQRPAEVVELAAATNLDLACAVVMLVKESSGGRNIWGNDGVPTGGAYVKGAAVTAANYAAYRAALRAGTAGRNGCGPTQLTYGPLQDQADTRGGCWDWRTNITVGFEHLAGLQRKYGVEPGFRAYNGGDQAAKSGTVPQADIYGRQSMTLLATWQARLAGAATPSSPAVVPPPAGDRVLTYGMRNDRDVEHLQNYLIDIFPSYPTVKQLVAAGGATGNYLGYTAAAVLEFQTRAKVLNADGSKPDGRTWGARSYAAARLNGWR